MTKVRARVVAAAAEMMNEEGQSEHSDDDKRVPTGIRNSYTVQYRRSSLAT